MVLEFINLDIIEDQFLNSWIIKCKAVVYSSCQLRTSLPAQLLTVSSPLLHGDFVWYVCLALLSAVASTHYNSPGT